MLHYLWVILHAIAYISSNHEGFLCFTVVYKVFVVDGRILSLIVKVFVIDCRSLSILEKLKMSLGAS